jgi:hypothetical protein
MPVSGIAFVRFPREPDDATQLLKHHPTSRRTTMSIERIARNAGFALAAAAIVFALGFTIEYQPVINALAR